MIDGELLLCCNDSVAAQIMDRYAEQIFDTRMVMEEGREESMKGWVHGIIRTKDKRTNIIVVLRRLNSHHGCLALASSHRQRPTDIRVR